MVRGVGVRGTRQFLSDRKGVWEQYDVVGGNQHMYFGPAAGSEGCVLCLDPSIGQGSPFWVGK